MGYIITDTRAEYFNRDTNCNELVASVVCDDVSDLPVNTATQKFILSSDARFHRATPLPRARTCRWR